MNEHDGGVRTGGVVGRIDEQPVELEPIRRRPPEFLLAAEPRTAQRLVMVAEAAQLGGRPGPHLDRLLTVAARHREHGSPLVPDNRRLRPPPRGGDLKRRPSPGRRQNLQAAIQAVGKNNHYRLGMGGDDTQPARFLARLGRHDLWRPAGGIDCPDHLPALPMSIGGGRVHDPVVPRPDQPRSTRCRADDGSRATSCRPNVKDSLQARVQLRRRLAQVRQSQPVRRPRRLRHVKLAGRHVSNLAAIQVQDSETGVGPTAPVHLSIVTPLLPAVFVLVGIIRHDQRQRRAVGRPGEMLHIALTDIERLRLSSIQSQQVEAENATLAPIRAKGKRPPARRPRRPISSTGSTGQAPRRSRTVE